MKQKNILIILIPSFLVTLLWVIFSVYHNHVTSTIKDPLTYQIIPIDGKFNVEGINLIKNRKPVDPIFTIEASTSITPSPTPEISEDEGAALNQSETLSPTPSIELAETLETPTPTEEIIFEEGE